jgi:hypothetical protein
VTPFSPLQMVFLRLVIPVDAVFKQKTALCLDRRSERF